VAKPLPSAGRAALISGAEAPGSGALLCDAYGGAISRIGPADTAFRSPPPAVLHPVLRQRQHRRLDRPGWTKMRPYVTGGGYQNYIEPSLQHWQQASTAKTQAPSKLPAKRVDPPLLQLPASNRPLTRSHCPIPSPSRALGPRRDPQDRSRPRPARSARSSRHEGNVDQYTTACRNSPFAGGRVGQPRSAVSVWTAQPVVSSTSTLEPQPLVHDR